MTQDFKIFDAHMHSYGIWLKPFDGDLLKYMDHYNVEKAIITTINRTKYYENEKTATPSDGSKKEESQIDKFFRMVPKGQIPHEDVIKIAERAPTRFFKFFWFNPTISPEKEAESYKVLEDHFKMGFQGVKIHSAFNMVRIPRDVIKLATFMQEHDKNLMLYIHSMPKTSYFSGVSCKEIAKLANMFPELKIIVGHAAYAMEFAVEVGMFLKKNSNVYFETSCSVSFGIFHILKTIGHERIVYGSDSPTASDLPLEIQKIVTLPNISDEIKQDILYNNISRLIEKL